MTAAKTAVLAHRTGSRFGTAQKVERIMPVVYSPLITSTPRTPIESWARPTPARLIRSGLSTKRNLSSTPRCGQRAAKTVQASRPMPIVSSSVTKSDQRVERNERNLVHSEIATRAGVTRPTSMRGRTEAAGTLTPALPCR